MSKVGEGDPRWLVKNREDGKNVNYWHWEEKNMFPWAKDKLLSFFDNAVVIDDDKMKIVVTELDEMNGEVTVNNRKAKLIYLYDFNLTLYWRGEMKETGAKGTGRIECIDVNVTDDSYDVYVTIDNETPQNAPLRSYLKANAFKFTREKVDLMLKELKEYVGDRSKLDEKSLENSFDTIRSKILFHNTTPNKIFSILTEKNMVTAFTGSESTISKTIGSSFELFGGNINGKIESLKENELIKQKWRASKWKRGHYSDVTIQLQTHDEKHCLLTLEQENVPKNEIEQTKKFWEESYWMRIMAVYGIMYEKK